MLKNSHEMDLTHKLIVVETNKINEQMERCVKKTMYKETDEQQISCDFQPIC